MYWKGNEKQNQDISTFFNLFIFNEKGCSVTRCPYFLFFFLFLPLNNSFCSFNIRLCFLISFPLPLAIVKNIWKGIVTSKKIKPNINANKWHKIKNKCPKVPPTILFLLAYYSFFVRGVLLPGAPDRAFIILILQQSCFSKYQKFEWYFDSSSTLLVVLDFINDQIYSARYNFSLNFIFLGKNHWFNPQKI